MKKFENFSNALKAFENAGEQDLDNEFIQGGIINKFSLQFELSWKLLKRLLAYEGDTVAASGSPRGIIKAAYRYYNFIDEAVWLEMLHDRNAVTHIYDSNQAKELITRIIDTYIPEFQKMRESLLVRYGSMLTEPDASR